MVIDNLISYTRLANLQIDFVLQFRDLETRERLTSSVFPNVDRTPSLPPFASAGSDALLKNDSCNQKQKIRSCPATLNWNYKEVHEPYLHRAPSASFQRADLISRLEVSVPYLVITTHPSTAQEAISKKSSETLIFRGKVEVPIP
uniref:Uncharacterized protein n=1 Tax=Cucumis melo TaxID=3656 RepID=A0A9I9E946_CUCME